MADKKMLEFVYVHVDGVTELVEPGQVISGAQADAVTNESTYEVVGAKSSEDPAKKAEAAEVARQKREAKKVEAASQKALEDAAQAEAEAAAKTAEGS